MCDAELDLKIPVTRILIGWFISDQFRFLGNSSPTPLLGQNFALSENSKY